MMLFLLSQLLFSLSAVIVKCSPEKQAVYKCYIYATVYILLIHGFCCT